MLSTAYLQLELALKAVNGSAVAQVLEKPFEKASLLQTVEQALRHAQVEGEISREWTPQRPVDRRAMEDLLRGDNVHLALQRSSVPGCSWDMKRSSARRTTPSKPDEPEMAERVDDAPAIRHRGGPRPNGCPSAGHPALFANLIRWNSNPDVLADRLAPSRMVGPIVLR